MLGTLALIVALRPQVAIPEGRGEIGLPFEKLTLKAYTYKPPNYRNGPLIMVFHGTLRNADEYRNDSENMARKFGALIVAPLFDSSRFPSIKYQRGGILKDARTAAAKSEWTYAYVPKIVQQIRRLENRPDMPYYLLGHSAGGQFLVRMAAFMQDGAVRIIAANPGSHLFPTTEKPFGYGYGNLPPELATDAVMKKYLAQPLTIYLGTKDDHPDEYFDDSAEAMKQGGSRFERGKNVYAFAENLAKTKGWKFNWRLIEAEGIEHDHQKMFEHPAFERALLGK